MLGPQFYQYKTTKPKSMPRAKTRLIKIAKYFFRVVKNSSEISLAVFSGSKGFLFVIAFM